MSDPQTPEAPPEVPSAIPEQIPAPDAAVISELPRTDKFDPADGRDAILAELLGESYTHQ
jgi:hypothetical protein